VESHPLTVGKHPTPTEPPKREPSLQFAINKARTPPHDDSTERVSRSDHYGLFAKTCSNSANKFEFLAFVKADGAHSDGDDSLEKCAGRNRFRKFVDSTTRERWGPPIPDERVYAIVEAIDEIAAESGKTVPQIALNWLLHRPTVASVIVGARNEEQLRQNLDSVGWKLTAEQIAKLDAASATPPAYPAWFQRTHGVERNPAVV
jgi:Aldo/keto reductase family